MKCEIPNILACSPEICGGRLRIDGTRITVQQIAIWYRQGYSAEDIADQYPHLTLAQVYTALAYYHANKNHIETELVHEKQEAERLQQQYLSMSRHHSGIIVVYRKRYTVGEQIRRLSNLIQTLSSEDISNDLIFL